MADTSTTARTRGVGEVISNHWKQYLTPNGFKRGRARLGLTGEQLAERFGVAANTIYRKEYDTTSIKPVDALAMTALLRIRFEEQKP